MSRSAAIRLVDTRSLEREQWLEVRKQGIGSSDAAAAVGLCPYKSQLELWMEKTGRAVRGEEPGQDSPMYWGTLLEPLVAAAYTERTERKVRRVNAVLQHPTYSFMLANIDREVVGVPDVQILECKTAGEFGSRLWRDGVPEYVQLQVQHQLAVTGKQAADVAVLLCGQKLEVHRIERDEEVISRLIVLEARFWEHVTQDTPPPADGSESAARALRSLYTGNDTSIDFSEDAELSATFDGLVLLRDEIAQMDKRAEQMRQQLEQSMGDASRAIFPTGEITYRRSKDGTSVDLKRLTEAHPDLVVGFTVERPGSRRFRIVPNQNEGA
ncbi:endonuclease [Stenotrophomonas sp. Betaine-02u-21]|uniref:YqaJ viral recombinase family nuclease n=1 Tax=unclassified Stenotrophomonas TaxID=196198 RepID=UPI000C332A4C|nr:MULTISPECIES: YqaJ viral recombinase family protein [unclassified Stenotrophomonas]MRI40979.1 endonuclease [Stenotrophomonas sp. MH181796]PKH69847.1 endonuclease [Stenotrophomonas sp. Betaine-02u-23]PKH74515.1 endonuclease [Stenotrophomonas sp. Betaine-02u-21]PKH94453.1 endonuclease [Stenotrophomonas sp. Bg11-02]